ncbi:TadE/TadG family type IV pilus assembly protein [Hoeflea prorocentri]|uniref:Pilus assembly protein n=1 Tax=Hoeflea prorocentri TaxID=1922333 RepID=A0A9X3ZIJ5_9HYPH|nr:TadE/TadG family type IV pilus assembly protein [Hoeflea prorocentri]MCY6382977.1 pilus assembly protein [Hoeflea prorocentri]MDA5400777.1 pilus assembly protein [Hoeflea prorocentri]
MTSTMQSSHNNRVSLKSRVQNFLGNKEGVGAIEFAFVAPILVVLYIGAVEMTVALSVDTKVSRAGNVTLDLITQGTTTSKDDLEDMEDVAKSILAPYASDQVALGYTAIQVNAAGTEARVQWSWRSDTETLPAKNSVITIPNSLMIGDAYYVRGEIANTHDLLTSIPFTGSTVNSFNLGETYFMRPRVGTEINCSDCNT